MSQWNDRLRNHPVWQALKSLGTAIDQAAAKEGIDATSIDSLERVRSVLAFCGKRLAVADPFLTDLRPVEKINALLTSATTELQAFVSDGNDTRLTTVNILADDILSQLATILTPVSNDELIVIGESISAYRAALEKHLAEALASHQKVKTQAATNQVSLTAIATEISEEKKKLAAIASESQVQFTADQTARATEFTAAQTERQTNFSAKATEFESSFSASQAERAEKFTTTATEHQAQFTSAQETRAKTDADAHQDRKEKFSALTADYTQKLVNHNTLLTEQREKAEKRVQEELTALKTEYESSAKGILDKIIAHKVDVEKLVGVIGNLGVTSGYLTTANHARTALYVWQALTVISLAGLIYFAYQIAFAPHVSGSDSVFYQGLATRIFLSITVGIFAAYAARQADKASIAERRNRKLALELEALGPYIAPLPEEMRHQFRAELGTRSFGVPDGEAQKLADNSPSPATAIDLLNSKDGKALIAEVVKLVQAAKP